MSVELEEYGEAWDPYLPKRTPRLRFTPKNVTVPITLIPRVPRTTEGGSHDFEKNDFGPMFDEACSRLIGTPITYRGRPLGGLR